MFFRIAKHSAFAAILSLTSLVDALYEGYYFVQDTTTALVVERLDPVMSPGGVSGHVHSIIGSNAFAPTMDYDLTQTATCSTAFIKADKSSYWMPSLYFHHPKNGSFYRVPEKPEHKIYYYNRAAAGQTIEEFPKDFRMIAGNPFQRSPAATDKLQHIARWDCHDPDLSDSGFPKGFTRCNYGLAATIHFPYCWNGNPFDINNPYDHMAYPDGVAIDSGACPSSHPHVLPHLFIEFWFNIEMFAGMYTADDSPWVLSQGDPTGYGFHGDFLNGWEEGVLLNAMNTCGIGESSQHSLDECFSTWTPAERDACVQKPYTSEVIDGWLDALPGCNPIQHGPGNATVQTCSNGATLGGSGSTGGYTSAVSSAANGAASTAAAVLTFSTVAKGYAAPTSAAAVTDMGSYPTDAVPTAVSVPAAATSAVAMPAAPSAPASNSSASSVDGLPSDWSSAGCYTDALNPRSLRGITFAWFNEQMTSTGCAKYCDAQGYSIAGTENGGQCFCGNELTDSGPAGDSVCSIACKGDAKQTCGGKAALSIFTKGSVSLPSGGGSNMSMRGARQH